MSGIQINQDVAELFVDHYAGPLKIVPDPGGYVGVVDAQGRVVAKSLHPRSAALLVEAWEAGHRFRERFLARGRIRHVSQSSGLGMELTIVVAKGSPEAAEALYRRLVDLVGEAGEVDVILPESSISRWQNAALKGEEE